MSDLTKNAFSAIAHCNVEELSSIFLQGDAISLARAVEDDFTLLHFAAYRGEFDCVQFLLKNNVKLNALTSSQSTSLHLAAFHGHSKVVKLLLENGAEILLRDEDGQTPLCIARMAKHSTTIKLLVRYSIEHYHLSVPPPPTYIRCSRFTSICSISTKLPLIIGALPKINSFKICLAEQLSPLFISTKLQFDEENEKNIEQLPILWIKVHIREIKTTRTKKQKDVMSPRILIFRVIDLPISVRDLKPGTRYAISVSTVNGIGCGPAGCYEPKEIKNETHENANENEKDSNDDTCSMNNCFVIETKSKFASFIQRYLTKISPESIFKSHHQQQQQQSHLNKRDSTLNKDFIPWPCFKDNHKKSNHPVLLVRLSTMMEAFFREQKQQAEQQQGSIMLLETTSLGDGNDDVQRQEVEPAIKPDILNKKNLEKEEFLKSIATILPCELSEFLLPILVACLNRGGKTETLSSLSMLSTHEADSVSGGGPRKHRTISQTRSMNTRFEGSGGVGSMKERGGRSMNGAVELVLEIAEQLAMISFHMKQDIRGVLDKRLLEEEEKGNLYDILHANQNQNQNQMNADRILKNETDHHQNNNNNYNNSNSNIGNSNESGQQKNDDRVTLFTSSSILDGKLGNELSQVVITISIDLVATFWRLTNTFVSTHLDLGFHQFLNIVHKTTKNNMTNNNNNNNENKNENLLDEIIEYDNDKDIDDNNDESLDHIDHHNVLYQKLNEFEIIKLKKIYKKLFIKMKETKQKYSEKHFQSKKKTNNHNRLSISMDTTAQGGTEDGEEGRNHQKLIKLYKKIKYIRDKEKVYKKQKEEEENRLYDRQYSKKYQDKERQLKEIFLLNEYHKTKLIDGIKQHVLLILATEKKLEEDKEKDGKDLNLINKKKFPNRRNSMSGVVVVHEGANKLLNVISNDRNVFKRKNNQHNDENIEVDNKNVGVVVTDSSDCHGDVITGDVPTNHDDSFGDMLAQIPEPIICSESPNIRQQTSIPEDGEEGDEDMNKTQEEQEQIDFSLAVEELANEVTKASMDMGTPGLKNMLSSVAGNQLSSSVGGDNILLASPKTTIVIDPEVLNMSYDDILSRTRDGGDEGGIQDAVAELMFEASEATKVL